MGLYSLEGGKIGKLGEIWERIKIIRVIGKFYLLGPPPIGRTKNHLGLGEKDCLEE